MNRIGEFEKVSYEQFHSSIRALFHEMNARGNDVVYPDGFSELMYDALKLPTRATTGSAGYDFKAPFSFTLKAGQTMKIPTGIRVKIDDGWWLGCLPRSSLGFKCRMQLDNTMGVIDGDYYYSDNEGHIFAKITNDSYDERKRLNVYAGDGFMQGIFMQYGITTSDDVVSKRNGGIGSTDKK